MSSARRTREGFIAGWGCGRQYGTQPAVGGGRCSGPGREPWSPHTQPDQCMTMPNDSPGYHRGMKEARHTGNAHRLCRHNLTWTAGLGLGL
jgi:hypothetical protein